MSPRHDPDNDEGAFGRFAFATATAGLVVVVLGLAAIWFVLRVGGVASPSSPLRDLVTRRGNLPPDKAMLYYTKDGRTLTGAVADLGVAGLPGERARAIVARLVEGRDADLFRNPVPAGTRLLSVFLKGDLAIVNLSKEFSTNLNGGIDAELLAVYSVVNSILVNIDGIDAVQIKIDGEELPVLRGFVDIEGPLVADTGLMRPR